MKDRRGSVFKALRMDQAQTDAADAPETVEAPAPAPAEPVMLHPKAEYAALELERTGARVSRLRVNFSDGSSSLFNYAYLVEVLTTSPQFVSLIFTSAVVTLQGHNIAGVLDDIQEERLLSLTPFDAKHHTPPERGAPVITNITRDTGEDEE